MKKIISSALVAIALIGSVAGASAASLYDNNAVQFPGAHSSLDQTLNFWQQFGDDKN